MSLSHRRTQATLRLAAPAAPLTAFVSTTRAPPSETSPTTTRGGLMTSMLPSSKPRSTARALPAGASGSCSTLMMPLPSSTPYDQDYADLVRTRYGIAQPFAPEWFS